jgi:hypothetical protein
LESFFFLEKSIKASPFGGGMRGRIFFSKKISTSHRGK